jgi:RNA polymerase sigma factor (sigma-70 family)
MVNGQLSAVVGHLRRLAGARSDELSDGQLLERFALRGDEAAFTALVCRHGPMVLGVCRRVLRGPDAEDAFQATFLVLFRRSHDLARAGSLAGYLHTVAYHAALKARAAAARRRRHEQEVCARTQAPPRATDVGDDLRPVLDEELNRLPARYRAAVVSCCLQGKTSEEAGRLLGCPAGTVKSRLARARTLLRTRLARRGVALPASLLTAATVSPALIQAAVRASVLARGGASPAPAASLAEGVLKATGIARLKTATAALLALGALLLAVGVWAHQTEPPGVTTEQPRPEAKRPPQQPAEARTMTVSGRVLDADGKAVADAEVVVVARGWSFAVKDYQVLKKGTTDKEGRYSLTVPRYSSGEGFLLAGKSGYGLRQDALNPHAEQQEATLTLSPEQPLRGRLQDLQGEAAVGVKVLVMGIGSRDDVRLSTAPEGLPLWPKPATTDAEGRFTIAGLPRNQEVTLLVQGDRFAWQPLRLAADNGAKEMTWSVSPARLLEGKVVCEDTDKPAANARAVIAPAGIIVRTDAKGRFTLSLPAVEQRNMPPLLVFPADGEPYLSVRQEIVWPRGATRHEVEVKLPRGVLVRGKVTEAGSGKPVAGAGVQFVPRESDNPNRRPNVLTGYQALAASGDDGSFRLAVLPGPCHLLVSGPGLDFIHQEVGDAVLLSGKPGGARLYPDGLVKLDVAPNAEPKEVTVSLRRGVTVRGRLLDPDGKPVARAVMACRLLMRAVPSNWEVEARDGVFALHGCDLDKEYPVHFLDAEHGWGGTVTLSGKQAGGDPVTVRLAPCGRATARLVDADGKPRKDYSLRPLMLHLVLTPGPPSYDDAVRKGILAADEEFAENLVSRKERVARRNLKTDAEGRFSYPGLIPGATYRLSAFEADGIVLKKEFRVEAEKALDLGDVIIGK